MQGGRAMVPGRLIKLRENLVSCLHWFFFSGGYYILIYKSGMGNGIEIDIENMDGIKD
jgi:hypothetical protein